MAEIAIGLILNSLLLLDLPEVALMIFRASILVGVLLSTWGSDDLLKVLNKGRAIAGDVGGVIFIVYSIIEVKKKRPRSL